MPDLKPCGTRAANLRHRRRGEPVCEACLAGAAADHRERRRKDRLEQERIEQERLAALVEHDDLALSGGRWVRRGLIQLWVPDAPPRQATTLLVCRVCAAPEGERCRTPGGRVVARHRKGLIEWKEAA